MLRIGDVVKYNQAASSLILKFNKNQVGIVIAKESAEFVVVMWNNGEEKVTFKDFLEVVKIDNEKI